jgi:type IV secretory pathway TrbD component
MNGRLLVSPIIICLLLVGIVGATTEVFYTATNGLVNDDTDTSYSNMRGAAGDTGYNNSATEYSCPYLGTTTTTDVYALMQRCVFSFDISSISDTATIDSAKMRVYRSGRSTLLLGWDGKIAITNGTLAANNTVVAGDYDAFGTQSLADSVAVPASNGDMNFTFDSSGITYLQNNIYSGNSVIIFMRDSFDANNTTPTFAKGKAVYTSWQTRTGANVPYLEITYHTGGSAPVASFTLQRPLYRIPGTLQVNDTSTNTPTAWNWSWGDGSWTNGTTQNATHKYTTRGKFSINLLCSNAGGSNTTPTAGTVRIVGYENLW